MTTPMEWLEQNHQLKKKNPLGWEYSSVVESLACAFKRKKKKHYLKILGTDEFETRCLVHT